MAIVELTKKQVIDALKKEPRLVHGTVFDVDAPTMAACSACAIGSVVRSTMALNTNPRKADMSISHAVCGGSPMFDVWWALSDVFESDTRGQFDDDGKGRAAAIAHVRKHFPSRIRIDIGTAKPRRGMKVVSK